MVVKCNVTFKYTTLMNLINPIKFGSLYIAIII